MSASSHIASTPSVTSQASSTTAQTHQPAEPSPSSAQKQARETSATQEAIAHIPMEPGAIIGLSADLNAQRNEIGLTVAVMGRKQETMETIINGLKRSGT